MKLKYLLVLPSVAIITSLAVVETGSCADGAGRAGRAGAVRGQNFAPARASTADPGIKARELNQARRIGQGVRSGQLTPEETKALLMQQQEIRQDEKDFKSDGNLTLEERKQLHAELNEASRDIYREKHDAEKMPWARPLEGRSPGDTSTPAIDYREIAQWHHIFNGIRSGELTWQEAAKLIRKEELLARLERRFKEDSSLTRRERWRLRLILDEIGAEIRREKHDLQKR